MWINGETWIGGVFVSCQLPVVRCTITAWVIPESRNNNTLVNNGFGQMAIGMGHGVGRQRTDDR